MKVQPTSEMKNDQNPLEKCLKMLGQYLNISNFDFIFYEH